MNTIAFEVTLKGFDPDTDETDHLVKWIKAPDAEALDRFLRAMKIEGHTVEVLPEGFEDMGFDDGIDAVIDEFGDIVQATAYWRNRQEEVLEELEEPNQ